MLSFENNVYFVKGRQNACIYDLNQGRLFHLKKEDVAFVERIIGKELSQFPNQCKEIDQIESLLEDHILTMSPVLNTGDISILAQKPPIDFVWVEVTEQCNLKCIHCYDDASVQSQKRMSVSDFRYVIDELINIGVRRMQIIGGEPFVLGTQLKEMVSYCSDRMDKLEIFTNATLLTPEWCAFLRDNSVQIAVSVYSYEHCMHDKVTQRQGSYELTIKGIQLLKAYGIKYRVANVLLKDIEVGERNTDLFELSHKRDVVRMSGRAKIDLLSPELIRKRLITKKSFSVPLIESTVSRMVYGHNCFSRRLYIASDLMVYPCVMERRICHGSLKEQHLNELIQESILRMNKDKINECSMCEFRYCCHDCRPDSLDGGIYSKPWMCTYDPESGEWGDIDDHIEKILHASN